MTSNLDSGVHSINQKTGILRALPDFYILVIDSESVVTCQSQCKVSSLGRGGAAVSTIAYSALVICGSPCLPSCLFDLGGLLYIPTSLLDSRPVVVWQYVIYLFRDRVTTSKFLICRRNSVFVCLFVFCSSRKCFSMYP